MKHHIIYTILSLLLGVAISLFLVVSGYEKEKDAWQHAAVIIISKQEKILRVVDYKGETLFSAPICIGKNPGNKQRRGDMKTPEGVFSVQDIQDSSGWKHDFGDGKGEIEGAYGPHFIRLYVPGHQGIGIHGTHKPETIGTRDSEGCIRLKNEDLEKLIQFVSVPMTVIITPASEDESASL